MDSIYVIYIEGTTVVDVDHFSMQEREAADACFARHFERVLGIPLDKAEDKDEILERGHFEWLHKYSIQRVTVIT